MTCKACGFNHLPMQDCKVAARIRANANDATVNSTNSVALPIDATVIPVPSVAFEHLNVYPNPYDIGWDKLAKTSTQRSREHRARKVRSI